MTTPNINWRDRYAASLDSLYTFAENKPADDVNTEAAAIALGIIEEIRLGIAAGLLDDPADLQMPAVPPVPVNLDCPRCPHNRRQHSTAGCTWENRPGDNVCGCELTYMDLAGYAAVLHDTAGEYAEANAEQADPVYVPKLSMPMRDDQPRDPRDEPPHY